MNDPYVGIANTMSWLADLANKAESILNTIDETTATALTSVDEISTNQKSTPISR